MRKRKIPFVLIAILIVLVGCVALMNGLGAPRPGSETPLAGDQHPEDQTGLADKAKESLDKTLGNVTSSNVNPKMKKTNEGPPPAQSPKQKPSDNATSAQWYRQ